MCMYIYKLCIYVYVLSYIHMHRYNLCVHVCVYSPPAPPQALLWCVDGQQLFLHHLPTLGPDLRLSGPEALGPDTRATGEGPVSLLLLLPHLPLRKLLFQFSHPVLPASNRPGPWPGPPSISPLISPWAKLCRPLWPFRLGWEAHWLASHGAESHILSQ